VPASGLLPEIRPENAIPISLLRQCEGLMASLLDRIYAALSNKRLFFKKGWGNLRWLQAACREGLRIQLSRRS